MSGTCSRCGSRLPGGRLAACARCLLQAALPPIAGGELELEEEIGRGGMGEVYRARHLRLGRAVAVKFLSEELTSRPEARARFEREAKAMALLHHPHIVAVHGSGEDEGRPYIVMDLVEGKPLSAIAPLPVAAAAKLAAQVCDALACAHGQGVIHRDIKPQNILVDASGRARVTDFGIARILDPAAGGTLTRTGVAAGTPNYMAPEVFSGAPPDPRMDVYSLGVVLYEAVMGRLPLGDFDLPPAPLDRVILKALAPDPARRYSGAAEMRRDLAPLAGEGPAPALGPEDRLLLHAVALLQAAATAVALWAFLVSVTPVAMAAGERMPLIMLGVEKLPDGRIVSRARFETWWTLGALAAIAAAAAASALLRRHWKRAGLEEVRPDRPVREAKWVFAWGAAAGFLFAAGKLMEGGGASRLLAYKPVLGGLMELAMLACFWTSILQARRTARPLAREPFLWIGLLVALVPPAVDLFLYLSTWKP